MAKMGEKAQTEEEKKETTPEIEEKTIMPTMMDEEEMEEQQDNKDLSSIIPSFDSSIDSKQDLQSRESELKGDGSTIIGVINNDEYSIVTDAKLPDAIDIKERTAEAIRNKNRKKKITPTQKKVMSSKAQSYTALGALIIIIGLVAFYIYYKHIPKDSDFKPLSIKVELGTKLPIRGSDYVKPGIGNEVDELSFVIDTSKVRVDEVGEYEFTVTHNNLTKTGIIYVVDTTPPNLEVHSLTIKKDWSITPKQFVVSCTDLTGCNYSFEEKDTETKYTTGGKHVVYIVATDAYDNKTVKKADLYIEEIIKFYKKTFPYNRSEGYILTEDYELHFDELLDTAVIINGVKTETYKFEEEQYYNRFKDKYYGEINYVFDEPNKIVTHTVSLTSVGQGYSRLPDVITYFNTEGFVEYTKTSIDD